MQRDKACEGESQVSGTNYLLLLGYAAAFIGVMLLVRVLYLPLRWLLQLAYSAVVGALVLWAINLVGNLLSFHLPVNLITSLVVGSLGVPGLCLILALRALVS
ncbi:MAG: pro-sigmaK processing inhibitor BofA family protein [Bacillota bacterium]